MRRARRSPPRQRAEAEPAPPAFDPKDLAGLFTTPRWLRDLGTSAWLAVGVTLLLVGGIWLLSLTRAIVLPILTAVVIAAVASPLIGALARRGLPRGAAAALLMVGTVVLAGAVVVAILAGVASQGDALRSQLHDATDTLAGWLTDLGVQRSTAQAAKDDANAAVGAALPQLLHGVGRGVQQLSSLVVFLSLTLLSLFFLLKDSRVIRAWAERHARVPPAVAHQMSGRILDALRGYFLGVTLVAGFNAVLVLLGAIVLGVPLAGTIALVTFLGAYVPYLGAWGAGAFAVLIALGGAGTEAALGMIVIQLLANGVLQQLVQPLAYGMALGIHPLAVLVVTIGGGALFGAVGLVLAAPLTAAATRIAADLAARPNAEGAR